MSVVKNNSSFSTATKKHESYSEATDFTAGKSYLKESQEEENNTNLFLKWMSSNKLNPVSLLLMLHLTTILINHLQADGFKTRKKLLLMALGINTENS